tara:strand:+ start:3033 stop:3386 length:354 start_codon:yes stop_codon:yes gene_type:complete
MTSRSKRIGYALEYAVVKFWEAYGVPVKRILGSGAFKHYSDTLASDVNLNGYRVECKRRKSGTGFASLYKWFDQDDAQILVLHADRKERLYVVKEKTFCDFARKMGWMKKPIIRGDK